MRPLASIIAVLLAAAPCPAFGQSAAASGSLGGGVIGDKPAGLAAIEVDLASESEVELGLALRLRFADGELLKSDWDEASDAGRVLRYFAWRRDFDSIASLSLAAGPLSGITIGHGSIVRGYASGLDFDRGRAGAELRARLGSDLEHPIDAQFMIDDVTSAELMAGRMATPLSTSPTHVAALGLTAAWDRERDVLLVALDGELESTRRWATGVLYSDAVARLGGGAGLHAGVKLIANTSSSTLELRGEARASSRGYVPGWISPMYLRDRDQVGESMDAVSITEHVRSQGTAGLSGLVLLAGQVTDVGSAELSLASRPGLPWQASGRLQLPSFKELVAGAWVVYEGSGDAALAAELSARLPHSLFVRAELARQYSRGPDPMDESRWRPQWLATVSIGAAISAMSAPSN